MTGKDIENFGYLGFSWVVIVVLGGFGRARRMGARSPDLAWAALTRAMEARSRDLALYTNLLLNMNYHE